MNAQNSRKTWEKIKGGLAELCGIKSMNSKIKSEPFFNEILEISTF